MRTLQTAKLVGAAVLLAAATWSGVASALTVEITTREPSLVGETHHFAASVTEGVGDVQCRWSIGDSVKTEFEVGQFAIEHIFEAPARATVSITCKDAEVNLGGDSYKHVAHYPSTEKRPTATASVVYDAQRSRIYNVNQDNDTISVVDPIALSKVAELQVYRNPEALAITPSSKLWVLHRDDYAIAIVDLDKLVVEGGFRLPYASQPIGLAMSPTGDAAYVTLMATGKLLKLDPTTGAVLAEGPMGRMPRGLSVSADGSKAYVTRFISPLSGGEVLEVETATLNVTRTFNLSPDTTTLDTDQKGRGLPNALFAAPITPDGREAWIPGKKDNIFRGPLRDGIALSQDNTVRPSVSILDLVGGSEKLAQRMDLDDRNLPSHVEFSELGDLAFVTVTGSNLVEVRDAYNKDFLTSLTGAGLAPRSAVLGPMGRLFVQGSMERSVVVFDVATILDASDIRVKLLTDIPVVENEKLSPEVLLGKQIFSNSADARMTFQGYLTCITCHFDGGDDGQVYDFTSRGEGFRNTISLRGKRGTGQGKLLWSGSFDEAQDFEDEIRDLFQGKGFIADDKLAEGTHAEALGDPKAGLSPELDALTAYLTTLDSVSPSPFRNPDGTMTADAVAGAALFNKLGCDFCHSGPGFTDSGTGRLHDVGTLKPSSGTRAGQPLLGLDTPSLLGVWESPPYLHDGSAATLRDVLTTQNPNDLHGFTSGRTLQEIDQLVAFLQQLDSGLEVRQLPFEETAGGGGGAGGMGGTAGTAGGGGAPEAATAGTNGKRQSSCSLTGFEGPSGPSLLVLLLPLFARRRRARPEKPRGLR